MSARPDGSAISDAHMSEVDHATLNRWVTNYASQVADEARHRKRPLDRSWRMDETYVRVKGKSHREPLSGYKHTHALLGLEIANGRQAGPAQIKVECPLVERNLVKATADI